MVVDRNLLGLAAAMALLGSGYGVPLTQSADDWGDEECRRKREAAAAAAHKEREARQEEYRKRAEARRAAEIARLEREAEDFEKLRRGIEPSTGQPISRQRRRALNRQNFRFIDADAPKGQHP